MCFPFFVCKNDGPPRGSFRRLDAERGEGPRVLPPDGGARRPQRRLAAGLGRTHVPRLGHGRKRSSFFNPEPDEDHALKPEPDEPETDAIKPKSPIKKPSQARKGLGRGKFLGGARHAGGRRAAAAGGPPARSTSDGHTPSVVANPYDNNMSM